MIDVYKKSKNWGAVSVASVNAQPGLSLRGTIYEFRNMDNGDRFDFLLGTLGIGVTVGVRFNQVIRNAWKALTKFKHFDDPSLYTAIPANNSFSADDLDWSPGAEATAGANFVSEGYTVTLISAWPFFTGAPRPGEIVNYDYFTGARIESRFDLGLTGQLAYQFMGRWVRLDSFPLHNI